MHKSRHTARTQTNAETQRTGNWIVIAAYGGSGLLIIGVIAIAKLL
jgi:hypothetical protein